MAAMAVVLLLDGPFAALVVFAAIEGLGSQPYDPMHMRVLPWLARTPSVLTAANGLTEILRMTGLLLGPGPAIILLKVANPAITVGVCAVGGLATALLFRGLGDKIPPSAGSGLRSALRSLNEGRRFITSDRDALVLVGWQAFAAACAATLQVYNAALSIDVLGLGDSGPAQLSAAFGVGGVLDDAHEASWPRGRGVS